ncbi:HD domain-containing protein [bacterium]|nr:HD domain-containing protein [bacterium]RQV98951.1 MAG: HD domain-containing protein [bacterium]
MNEVNHSHKLIEELVPGEKVATFFILRKKELKTKKDGTPYLLLELGDRSGRVSATLWNNAQSIYEAIDTGDAVKVMGSVIVYKDANQIAVEKIRKADSSDHIDINDFVPQRELDTEILVQDLEKTIESVKTVPLKRLLQKVFHDPWWMDRFREAPGGKLWHHAYLGGLLEHTLAVVKVCETMALLYPKADRDLLMTGALLHDIGKIDEYGYDQGYIDFTDEGRLWGHISIGAHRIRTIIEKLEMEEEGFPRELKRHVLHLILSHQGKLEFGSPVLPMTLEAMILFYADEMDSKANALLHIIERDTEPGKRWSKYVPLLDRFIYLGSPDLSEKGKGSEQSALF